MEVSTHIKAKWSIRGDYTRTATDAWTNGVEVRLPNYKYGDARYDEESRIILLSNGDKITTAITRYEHTELVPLEEVECSKCSEGFKGRKTCPSCGSADW